MLLIILGAILFSILVIHVSKTSYWVWLILLFPILFIAAYFIDAKEKKEINEKRTEYLEAGKLLFLGCRDEFSAYYQSYLRDKKKKTPIEILCEFADARGLIQVIDWRGEDSEKEIEGFIEKLLGQKIFWTHSAILRSGLATGDPGDGEFIVDLFKAVDKDLMAIGQRLLFLGVGDSYEFTVVGMKTFNDINKMKISGLRGAGELEK